MNVKNKIMEIRLKNEQRLKRRSERENLAVANRLKKLKTQREKYEGKARLKKFEDSERKRISVAKASAKREGKITGLAKKFVKTGSKVNNARKKVASRSGKLVSSGNTYRPSVDKSVFQGNVREDFLRLK